MEDESIETIGTGWVADLSRMAAPRDQCGDLIAVLLGQCHCFSSRRHSGTHLAPYRLKKKSRARRAKPLNASPERDGTMTVELLLLMLFGWLLLRGGITN
jgi:hypothetical protein